MLRMTVAALALAVLLTACRGPEGYVIRGVVLDAETGREVSREGIYLHFFCDDLGHKLTLDPEDCAEFEVTMPKPNVRIRAADGESRYRLFEQTVEVKGDELRFDIRLEPTHYVLLTGRVLDGRTGAVIVAKPGIGDTPLFYLEDGDGRNLGTVSPETDGTYSIRVPRGKIVLTVVDTALSPRDKTLDLSDATGDTRKLDLVLE